MLIKIADNSNQKLKDNYYFRSMYAVIGRDF